MPREAAGILQQRRQQQQHQLRPAPSAHTPASRNGRGPPPTPPSAAALNPEGGRARAERAQRSQAEGSSGFGPSLLQADGPLGRAASVLPSRDSNPDLPRKREEVEDARPPPPSPSPSPSPPPASGSGSGSLEPEAPPPSATHIAERAPGPSLSLEALQERLEVLKALQGQYLRGQLRIRRTSRDFPRALRALSLQICRSRRRLIRAEVRLQRREKEGARGCGQLPRPTPPPRALPLLRGLQVSRRARRPFEPAGTLADASLPPAGVPQRCQSPSPSELLALASSRHGLSAVSTLSSCSLLLLPAPPPPPPPPPLLPPQLPDLHEALETFLDRQARHLHERQRDYRSCQECLRSIKTLRRQLRRVRSRLWRVEAELGIQVPPRELSVDDAEEKEEDDDDDDDGPPWMPPALPAAWGEEGRGPSPPPAAAAAQSAPPADPATAGQRLEPELPASPQ
ncbi:uncharacterized protein PHA67_000643 [Liasis olivaceus]